ncbi:YaaC family protein [Bradyrhizobium sp. McL0615]|uniref:YaaC family protein n=1 Tax=Bradyrhizobium sp. McL0615 TaxID=3415673 RepID=UPI003CFB52E1
MIITVVKQVRTADPSAYAWATLRKFQNVDLVASKITTLHNVPEKHRADVRKQALQIRYCLLQAREYFAAAATVSLATKPNLLYYGTMSLALAEILFKQSGDSSLDRAREQNRHHGLTMTVAGTPRPASLSEASGLLKAYPMEVGGIRKGTFNLWHHCIREHPLPGILTRFFPEGGSTDEFANLWGAEDKPYKPIPSTGISLEDCLASLPLLLEHSASSGVSPNFVRGRCAANQWIGDQWRRQSIFVLYPDKRIGQLLEGIKINPNKIEQIDIREIGEGIQVTLENDWVNGMFGFPVPPGASINSEEWRMWTNDPPLNEFGYYYVGLYLAGNYARYYPDKWLSDVELSSPISLAIEEMCSTAEWRVPWLALCELDQTLYVNEA